ncbi:MAG: hypothetical protein OXN18_07970 [Gemmatimonadota bacterium]|nr:hypothetical protein [Gemmatimonadota bacterium]
MVNGEGRIEREYALGSGWVDLLVIWPAARGRKEIPNTPRYRVPEVDS